MGDRRSHRIHRASRPLRRRKMRKYLPLILTLVATTAPAQVGLFANYAQWTSMSAEGRTAYIMGAFDTMQIVAANETAKKVAAHRHDCMMRAAISAVQFAEHVRAFAAKHPNL